MENTPPDDIEQLKRLLAEQEALNRILQAKLEEREREIDRLLSQLDKLQRMNFGSQSEKISRRIAQTEAELKALQQESDAIVNATIFDRLISLALTPSLAGRIIQKSHGHFVRLARANRSLNHFLVMKNVCCQQKPAARTVAACCDIWERMRLNNWS